MNKKYLRQKKYKSRKEIKSRSSNRHIIGSQEKKIIDADKSISSNILLTAADADHDRMQFDDKKAPHPQYNNLFIPDASSNDKDIKSQKSVIQNNIANNKLLTDKLLTDKLTNDKLTNDKLPNDKIPLDTLPLDKIAQDKSGINTSHPGFFQSLIDKFKKPNNVLPGDDASKATIGTVSNININIMSNTRKDKEPTAGIMGVSKKDSEPAKPNSIINDHEFHRFESDDAIRKLFMKEKKIIKKRTVKQRFFLRDVMRTAGYDTVNIEKFKETVLYVNALIIIIFSLAVLFYGSWYDVLFKALLFLLMLWLLLLPLLLLISWVCIYLFLDYKRYRRRLEIEDVWPEYLQLVVANINAGMLIDVALWNAVKPKYKVLVREIEEIAKQSVTGVDIVVALQEFSEKYDSPMLKRTVSLLIEGMGSGGKIATLLNKIALDIQDTKIMKKEMSASVMTYAIFISFATIVAAPFLFGLSTQLLIVMQKIIGSVSQTSSTSSFLSFSTDTIAVSDFKIFAYIMLAITSFMSACIIGSIRKGSVKDGLKFIPVFIAVTLVIYYIASSLLAALMSSFI